MATTVTQGVIRTGGVPLDRISQTFLLPVSVRKGLEETAKIEGCNMTDVIVTALLNYFPPKICSRVESELMEAMRRE